MDPYFVTDPSDGFDALTCGVFQRPVHVPFARIHRAGVTASLRVSFLIRWAAMV